MFRAVDGCYPRSMRFGRPLPHLEKGLLPGLGSQPQAKRNEADLSEVLDSH